MARPFAHCALWGLPRGGVSAPNSPRFLRIFAPCQNICAQKLFPIRNPNPNRDKMSLPPLELPSNNNSSAPGSAASSTTTRTESSAERGGERERADSAEGKGEGGGSIIGKRNIAQLASEQIEPYVRKRRSSASSSERSRKRAAEHLNEEEQNILRLCINSRERRRMHDLNDALDELRKVIPCTENGGGSGGRRISKIGTIVLATHRIMDLNNQLAQLRAQNEKLVLELLLSAKTTSTTKCRGQEEGEEADGGAAREQPQAEKRREQPPPHVSSTTPSAECLFPSSNDNNLLKTLRPGPPANFDHPILDIPPDHPPPEKKPSLIPANHHLPVGFLPNLAGAPSGVLPPSPSADALFPGPPNAAFTVQQLLSMNQNHQSNGSGSIPMAGDADLLGQLLGTLSAALFQATGPQHHHQQTHLAPTTALGMGNRKRKKEGTTTMTPTMVKQHKQ